MVKYEYRDPSRYIIAQKDYPDGNVKKGMHYINCGEMGDTLTIADSDDISSGHSIRWVPIHVFEKPI